MALDVVQNQPLQVLSVSVESSSILSKRKREDKQLNKLTTKRIKVEKGKTPTTSPMHSSQFCQQQILYGFAIEEALLIRHDDNRFSTLKKIALAQAQIGDVEGALETVRFIEDDSTKFLTLREIAKAQAQAYDIAGALETLTVAKEMALLIIGNNSDKSFALQEISLAEAKARDIEGALDTALLIGHDEIKSYALSGIALAQAQACDIEGAKKNFYCSKRECSSHKL